MPFTITAPTDEKKLEFGEANCCVASKVCLTSDSSLQSFHCLDADIVVQEGGAWDADKVAKTSRDITLDVFAHDESASVQVSLSIFKPVFSCLRPILSPCLHPSFTHVCINLD